MDSIASLFKLNILNLVIGMLVLILILYVFNRNSYKRSEGFQDDATNAVVPDGLPVALGKEHCRMLHIQLNQYKQVKKENPDTQIANLDETIAQLTEYYTKYSCDKHSF
jgi:hypothetical protein